MNLEIWAENEIKIAIERERKANDTAPDEWDYGAACYESAYKAFKSLLEDGHSGYSIGVTKYILNRLIDGKPLTPIEDTDDAWNDTRRNKDVCTQYQCKRMSSLFKYVYDTGYVKYKDIDRVITVDVEEDGRESRWYNGFICDIVDEMFPIAFPYMPEDKPYKVYREYFTSDLENGYYDTMWITHLITPNGKKVDIDRYFKESEDSYIEISRAEFEERMKGE